MRLIIIVCVMLVCFPVVYGSSFSTITGWYHTGDSIVAGEHNLQLLLSGDRSSGVLRIGIDHDAFRTIRFSGCSADAEQEIFSCESCIVAKGVEVCLLEVSYRVADRGKRDGALIDPVTFQTTPGMRLRIRDLSPDVRINRQVSPTNFYLGREVKFKSTVTNEGESPAYDIVVREVFPDHVVIKDVSSNAVLGTSDVTMMVPRLRSGESAELTFTILVTSLLEAQLSAVMSYTFQGEAFDTTTRVIRLSPRAVFDVRYSFSDSRPEAGEQVDISIQLRNQDPNATIQVSRFHVPAVDGLEIVSIQGADPHHGGLLWSGSIPAQSTYTINVSAIAHRVQSYVLSGNTEYLIEGVQLADKSSATLRAQRGRVQSRMVVSPRNLLAGDEGDIVFTITNTDLMDYVNGQITFHSPLFADNITIPIQRVEQQETFEVTQVFVSPLVNHSTDLSVSYSGILFGASPDPNSGVIENITFQGSGRIKVIPLHEAITVRATLDPRNPRQGRSAQATVSVKNILDRRTLSRIEVTEIIPDWLNPTGVTPQAHFFLEPQQERIAYSYRLSVPMAVETLEPNISTRVSFMGVTIWDNRTLSLAMDTQPDLRISSRIGGSLVRGNPVSFSYTIRNAGDKTAYDVNPFFRLTSGIELMSGVWERIDVLEPGEQFTLTRFLRPVGIGQVEWSGFSVSYKDSYGNVYVDQETPRNVTVEPGSTSAPLLRFEREAVHDPESDIVTVSVVVSNDGGSATTVTLQAGNEQIIREIEPGMSSVVTYTTRPRWDGNVSYIDPIRYSYRGGDQVYESITNMTRVVRQFVATVGEFLTNTTQVAGEQEESIAVRESTSSRTLTQRIYDLIANDMLSMIVLGVLILGSIGAIYLIGRRGHDA